MNKSKMLGILKTASITMDSVAKSDKYVDDIGYKPLYRDLVAMSEFILANAGEFDDYEVLSFLEGIVIPSQLLKDTQLRLGARERRLELVSMLAEGRMSVLKQLYSYDERTKNTSNQPEVQREAVEFVEMNQAKDPAYVKNMKDAQVADKTSTETKREPVKLTQMSQEANLTPTEDKEDLQIATPTPMLYVKEDPSLQHRMTQIKELVEMLPITYGTNSKRFEELHFGEEENDLYTQVGLWSNRAVEFTKDRIDNPQPNSYAYCLKYLNNSITMLTLMNRILNAQDEFTMKRYAKALKKFLEEMERYFGDQPKQKQV